MAKVREHAVRRVALYTLTREARVVYTMSLPTVLCLAAAELLEAGEQLCEELFAQEFL